MTEDEPGHAEVRDESAVDVASLQRATEYLTRLAPQLSEINSRRAAEQAEQD